MLNQDCKERLSELLKSNADFLLVGAYVLAVYDITHATRDIDILTGPMA